MNRIVAGLAPIMFLVPGVVAAQSAPPRKDIRTIAKAANGSVVSIVMSDKDGKPVAQGSGFVVSSDGLIVTNYHVIAQGTSAVVKLPDDALYAVDCIVGFDKTRDVAVIKAHGQNFRIILLGNSDKIQVGEEVVAIGNPLSLESTVSNGIVSGIRSIKEEGGKYLQITAPISSGSSGGPLFNMAGEVIGITTMRIRGGENLNFAIPINEVKKLVADAERSRKLLADPEFFKWWGSNFPNEPTPKETRSEATHEKPTLEEQKVCSEQAAKVLQENRLGEKDNPWQPTFSAVSHYDASTGRCYILISRSIALRTNDEKLKEKFNLVTRGASDGMLRGFRIEDAFGGRNVGTFVLSMPYENTHPALCTIQPPGEPEIRCSSETEFDDLAFKYFGIQK